VFWFRLQPATKATRGHPSPRHGAKDNGKKTGRKMMGRDKGSLTEQQTKGTVTTMIQKKGNTQNKTAEQNHSLRPNRRCALPSCK